jgi:hypothetical protein
MDKGEAKLFRLFVIFSIFLFVFLIVDLSMSYISTYNLVKGEYKIVPVISLLPTF